MDKLLELKIYVDGVNDTPFPQGAEEPIEIGAFRYDAKRMGGAPTITATVSYPTCLDKEWNDLVYTELNGEKYFLKQTPTSTLSNEDARYKHDLVMVAERVILDDAYFFDAVVGNPLENDKPVTNSTNFNFYGSIEEFVKRMNASLQYTKLQSVSEDGVISGYRVILDDDVVTREQKQVVFDGAAFSQALQECYNTFGIPFYFDGKEIHVGYTNNVISDVLEYGVDGALLSASKQNANFKVVNRATGMGSSDNIPYYYPNNAPKGEIQITASESNQGITTEDIEIRDTEVFSQSELRVDEIYTYHGSGKVSQSIEAKVLSTDEVSSFDENTISLLQVHTTKNNPEKIEVEFLLNFDGHGDADIDLNWSLNIPQYYIYSQNENRDYTSSSHLALEVEGVYLSTNDAEYEELTYTKKEEKTRYLQWCKVNKDYADMTQEGHALRQIGLTIQTPNILGVARIKVVSKLKTVGVFWESLVPSITNPSCDITYNAEVKTHITGGWKPSQSDTTINMDACGVRFLKNPVYGDSFSWTIIEYIKTATNLQPSIYRATKGAERFYNAINYPFVPTDGYELKYGEYIKDGEVHNDAYKKDNGEYYEFTNEYKEARPREHVFTVDDIKPTIKEMTNDISWSDTDSEGNPITVFQRIDMFSEFAYDRGDNDETYIDENGEPSFKHPYFFAKLRKLDFNLFDCAIEQQPMTISMTAGHCGACNFEVGVSEEYPRMNPVQVDENGNLVYDEDGRVLCGLEDFQESVIPQDEQQDTINHEVWIALKKEETTYGILMPKAPKYEGDTLVEAGHRPKACSGTYSNDGDTFVILGINLPEEYVLHAERKLEKAIVKYIWENNVEKFNFSVNFSRIFLAENPSITDLINENARLTRVKYNGDEYMLYVSSYSYVMNEGDVLPEIRIELDDTLTISQNALQNAINEVRSEIGQAIDALDVAAIGSRYFLRKDVDDVAQATIDFRKGVFFGEGGGVRVYEDGSAKLTIDYLEVTKKATFTSLEIQEKTHAGGQILLTPAAMVCNGVEELDDVYRCYFQNQGEDGQEIFNQFAVGDQAISQTFNEWGGHYYWRLVVGVGDDYIDLSKTECSPESDAPSIGDKIIQLGNQTNEERQNAIVIAAYGEGSPYIIQYKGINTFALSDDKIVTKLSSTENIFTGKVHMEMGSSLSEDVLGDLEFGKYNLLRNTAFTGDFVTESLEGGTALDENYELFSNPLRHWNATNVVVQDSEEGQSEKEIVITNGSLSQELHDKMMTGENYVLSFKAKGTSLTYSVGGVTENILLESEWSKHVHKFAAKSNESIFTIESSDASICDLQLERGTVQSAWGYSMWDNQRELAKYQSLQYLEAAIKNGSTDILGGLIMSNIMLLSNPNKEENTAGVSGIDENASDVAFWGGGDFEQAIATAIKYDEDPTYKPSAEELASMAKFVVTHGGKAIMNEAVVRGKVYATDGEFEGKVNAKEGNLSEGFTIGDTFRVYTEGNQSGMRFINQDDYDEEVDQYGGVALSTTGFSSTRYTESPATVLFQPANKNSRYSALITKGMGGFSPVGDINIALVLGAKNGYAIYCKEGMYAGLRPSARVITEAKTSDSPNTLLDLDYSVLVNLTSGTCYIELPKNPLEGQEYYIESRGANMSIKVYQECYSLYSGSTTAAGNSISQQNRALLRFKYYAEASLWACSWLNRNS